MKKKFALCIMLIIAVALCACNGTGKAKKEDDILADIPTDFLVISNYCDDTEYLNYDSVEILDRSTEEGVDNIYFWLNASNANYEVKVHCHFIYCYSGSEWILDYAEVNNEDFLATPITSMNDTFPTRALSNDGIDNYILCENDFDNDEDGNYYCTFCYEYCISWPLYEQTVERDFYYKFNPILKPNDYGATIKIVWSCENDESFITDEEWDIYRTWSYVNKNDLFGDTTYTITLSYVDDESIKYEARYEYENFDGEYPTIWSGSGTIPVEIEYDNSGCPTMVMELPMKYEQIEPFDVTLGGGQVKHFETGSEAPGFDVKFTGNQGTLQTSTYHWAPLSD